jgi:hypothetical protein
MECGQKVLYATKGVQNVAPHALVKWMVYTIGFG